ncbi:MAG: helix-turn-helix domain-containing protein [Clostridia bacterium]|nr:helix-turn-helix domain-containing protein [Clostridia bacterium]
MQIGNILKDLRSIRGYSQQEVADKTGISRSVLSQYENNLVEPTAYVVKKLATFYEVSADYLLGLEDDFGARTTMPINDGLSSEERNIIDDFRSLNPECQKLVKSTIKTLLTSSAGSVQKKKV